MHFRTPISFLYFSSPLWAFFISPTAAHIRNDRIYLPSFSRAAPVRVDSWNLHDVVSHPETLWASPFFLQPFYPRLCILFVGHANSTVNWIVSCTSNLSGKKKKKTLEFSDIYIKDNSNIAGTYSIKKMRDWISARYNVSLNSPTTRRDLSWHYNSVS